MKSPIKNFLAHLPSPIKAIIGEPALIGESTIQFTVENIAIADLLWNHAGGIIARAAKIAGIGKTAILVNGEPVHEIELHSAEIIESYWLSRSRKECQEVTTR